MLTFILTSIFIITYSGKTLNKRNKIKYFRKIESTEE